MNDRDKEKHEINKLKAQLSIVRSNLKRCENENSNLRMAMSKSVLCRQQMEDEVKRKLEMELKEEVILQSQRKYFKPNSLKDVMSQRIANDLIKTEEEPIKIDQNPISPVFILENTIDWCNLCSDENIAKMKFFRDYFFDDFYSMDFTKFVPEIEKALKSSTKQFVELFSLFCCKKEIFLKFSPVIFDNFQFLQTKIEILINIPAEWTVDLLDNHLKRFIEQNKRLLGQFICNIAANCPFSLYKIYSQNEFEYYLRNLNLINYQIIREICKNKIPGYVDERTLHLIPIEHLRMMFKDEYFDFC